MNCPYCKKEIFPEHSSTVLERPRLCKMQGGIYNGREIYFESTVTVCPNCAGAAIDLYIITSGQHATVVDTVRAIPRGGPFPSCPAEVPAVISADYAEANEVLPISPKASAALARRCLQAILSAHGYQGRNLVKQVDAVLAEADSAKALPTALKENIDAIRNFGNFSAHPVTDQTTFQVVEVEEGEAEWCLQILLDLFDHYYVAPARAAEKRAALSAKLAAAGKPPMKA